MANFRFADAFNANPIGSFIDGRLAAEARVKAERDRQVDLWYKYQNLVMAKEKHAAGLAAMKQRSAMLDTQMKMQEAFTKGGGSGAYGGYYGGASAAPDVTSGNAVDYGQPRDGMPGSGAYEGYDPTGWNAGAPNLFSIPDHKPAAPAQFYGPAVPTPSSPAPIYAPGMSKPGGANVGGFDMIAGNAGNDDLSNPYDKPVTSKVPTAAGGVSDGYPVPMSYGEAEQLYGAGGMAPDARQAPAGPRSTPRANPFDVQPARRPRRYDPRNTTADEMYLAYFGDN